MDAGSGNLGLNMLTTDQETEVPVLKAPWARNLTPYSGNQSVGEDFTPGVYALLPPGVLQEQHVRKRAQVYANTLLQNGKAGLVTGQVVLAICPLGAWTNTLARQKPSLQLTFLRDHPISTKLHLPSSRQAICPPTLDIERTRQLPQPTKCIHRARSTQGAEFSIRTVTGATERIWE